MLHAAITDEALDAMGERAQLRVMALPALTDPEVLDGVVTAVLTHRDYDRLRPLADHLPEEARRRFTAAEST